MHFLAYPRHQPSLPAALAWQQRLWAFEPLAVLAATPLLLFPRGPYPWIALGLVLMGWLIRGIATREWWTFTPIDRPIVAILLMMVVSMYASVDRSLSTPKAHGILLGVIVYYAIVRSISTKRRFWIGIALVVASIVGVSLIGLVGTEWSVGKIPLLQRAYELIPRLIRGVETSFGRTSGFQPNEVGGTLAFLLPVPLVLLAGAQLSRFLRVVLACVVLIGLAVVALTVSRSAFLALAVVAPPLVAWSWRRSALFAVVLATATLSIYGFGLSAMGDFLMEVDVSTVAYASGTLTTRQEVWNRGWLMVQDFPFTGIGLNTFPRVLDTLYPSFLAASDVQIPHAHNIFLQTAVDLGLGGLLGFVGLWIGVIVAGLRALGQARMTHEDKNVGFAVVGLLGGILAYLVFGLTDAITLGAKPMVALWLVVGLIIAASRITQSAIDTGSASTHEGDFLVGQSRTNRRPLVPLDLTHHLAGNALHRAQTLYWLSTYLLVILGYGVVALAIFWR